MAYSEAEHIWHTNFDAWHSKQIIGNLSENRSNHLLRLKRTGLAFTISLLTGHGRFNKHLHRMNISTSPNCRFCGETETAEHLLCECEDLSLLRYRIFNKVEVELPEFA